MQQSKMVLEWGGDRRLVTAFEEIDGVGIKGALMC